MQAEPYRPQHPVRFVTAASLFDGHDAAINLIRRLLQSSGAEVIHLGHNRSVEDVAETAIEEDVQGVAISSYQGGHIEYFKYLRDVLDERGAGHIQIFGGGGGVIVPEEIAELEAYGITRVFSPDDGLNLGLQGMINVMLQACDFPTVTSLNGEFDTLEEKRALARVLTTVEDPDLYSDPSEFDGKAPVVGLTGTGGAGKSTLTDELIRRFLNDFDDLRLAVLAVDPTRRRTGGALLGDRIRMNALYGVGSDRVYMRSFATRTSGGAMSEALSDAVAVCRAAGFDLILLETAGIGQGDTGLVDLADVSLYVMTQEYGAPTQLEKIGMLDVADFVVLNKFEKRGSADALRDIRKQVQRNRGAWTQDPAEMPVFPTRASQFNDPSVTRLYLALLDHLNDEFLFRRTSNVYGREPEADQESFVLVPPQRQRYLAEISETVRAYHAHAEAQADRARKWGEAVGVLRQFDGKGNDVVTEELSRLADSSWARLDPEVQHVLEEWEAQRAAYRQETYTYQVRGRQQTVPLYTTSLSGLQIPRVVFPDLQDSASRVRFVLRENVPGRFPFTAGVFPFKRTNEDPTRMFAGEGSPERTNKRFHLISAGLPAKRLSTAFDSVTLYGFDPDERPDIYGKVGNAGVSICTLDDMKKLYSGFDLCDPATSVSMTINGPAPMLLAMFMNTAIDQQVERWLKAEGRWETVAQQLATRLGENRPGYVPYASDDLPEGHDGSGLGLLGTSGRELVGWDLLDGEVYKQISAETLRKVRGTVQADILKEDQAQNTCIFSTEFALRMMGDVQAYFIEHEVRNYYSVSISGYHIAEAGANPISQLAFTLANGFTYVESYLARGMAIDDFAPNLSFFFSNGLDPEYNVIGRVARRIWAIAMRDRYGANERSQKLKYHIQTSGRSLHAQEIAFNDIRTTLQALIAVYDNCNSLHTNAYDEAVTTPTEESVRRAMAIQLIINRELGLAKNENPLQGAYIIEELTDLVEEAVLQEFERLSERGGVLGAMETMYQRGRIQDESMRYEQKKHTGELPIIGVNTFVAEVEQANTGAVPLMRSTTDEKERQLQNVCAFQRRHADVAPGALRHLQDTARRGENLFEALMETVTICSLGQITQALFEVGGQYRRNM